MRRESCPQALRRQSFFAGIGKMDVAENPAQIEVLVSGLSWGLRNVASSVLTSEQAVFYSSQAGKLQSHNSRLLKITVADASRYANLATLKLCFTLTNEDADKPLELLTSPLGCFDSYRLMSQGTTLTDIGDSYARLGTTLDALQGREAKIYKSQAALPLRHSMLTKLVPNGDGRRWSNSGNLYNATTGADEQQFDGTQHKRPVISDIEVERYVCIPPGESRVVCMSPICPIVQSGLMWPLPHASLEFQWMLQPIAESICAGDTPGNTVMGGAFGATIERSKV